jgi:hypothetical protein
LERIAQNTAIADQIVNNSDLISCAMSSFDPSSELANPDGIAFIATLTSQNCSFVSGFVKPTVLEQLSTNLANGEGKTQSACLQILVHMTALGPSIIQPLFEAKIIPVIVNCLYFGEKQSQAKATEVFLNIATVADREQCITILEEGGLDAMSDMFSRNDPESLYLVLQVYRYMFTKAKKYGFLDQAMKSSVAVGRYIEPLFDHPNDVISKAAGYLLDNFIDVYVDDDIMN